jgi:hypothetical protein
MDDEGKKYGVPISSTPPPSLGSEISRFMMVPDSDTAIDVLTVAGKVLSNPKDTIFGALRLIRAGKAHRFEEQLRTEWTKLAQDGKIKSDYGQTDQARTIFSDTLESLGQANFDNDQLDLLRRLFLAAAAETETDRDSFLVREYITVGRSLSAGEIRVLAAYYNYLPEWTENPQSGSVHLFSMHDLINVLQGRTRLKQRALLERLDKSLSEKDLVRSAGPHGSQTVDTRLFRLTDFGFAFCEFLQSYERLKKPEK